MRLTRCIIFLLGVSFSIPALCANWDSYSDRQKQQEIVFNAQKHFSKRRLQTRNTRYRNDCSGFVQMVLFNVGHDLNSFYRTYRYETNGVDLIRKYVERVGDRTQDQKPEKGDLIFFSNTYDKNRDGRVNDSLTHIGIIEKIDRDGTITFLHYIQSRVRRGYMNLKSPSKHQKEKKVINTFLRRRSSSSTQTLAAQLFDGFGRLKPTN